MITKSLPPEIAALERATHKDMAVLRGNFSDADATSTHDVTPAEASARLIA
jgi:hypothetical protein